MIDYIVVGKGLAGTFLSYFLEKKGFKVKIIDRHEKSTSSKVAAGLFNPITGRKLNKTWLADDLFPFIHALYPNLEKEFNSKFFHPKPILKIFASIKQQNDWWAKSGESDYSGYFNENTSEDLPGEVNAPHGCMEILKGGFIDTSRFLNASSEYFRGKNMLVEEEFDYSSLEIKKESVSYKGLAAEKIFFCEGYEYYKNPWFNRAGFNPAKGEILTISSNELDFNSIIIKDFYIFKVSDGLFKAGSTYHWKYIGKEPEEKGIKELTKKLDSLLRVPYKIEEVLSGIRPASKDLRPIIGRHPKHLPLYFFNGLGAKGITIAPYFAFLISENKIEEMGFSSFVNVSRFWK